MQCETEPTDAQLPDDTQLLATVTICTRNRAQSLARTLRSIAQAAARVSAPWELLVVDNGSTDNTQDIIKEFQHDLPIRSVVQDIAGLSNARNAGLAAARGTFILWTDDDVLVDAGWLQAYFTAFQTHPETGVFGGRAVPRYEEPSTSWFAKCEKDLEFLLAIRDFPEWNAITPDRLPYGLNFAVRADIQRQHTFDINLGVAPGRRMGGEETTMICCALADGATGRWVWDATVFHLIPPERQTKAYIFQYYRSLGYAHPKVPVERDLVSRTKAFATASARLLRKGAMAFLRKATGDLRWVPSYTEYARTVGAFDRLRNRQPG